MPNHKKSTPKSKKGKTFEQDHGSEIHMDDQVPVVNDSLENGEHTPPQSGPLLINTEDIASEEQLDLNPIDGLSPKILDLPLDDRDTPDQWRTIFTQMSETSPNQQPSSPVFSEAVPADSENIPENWMSAFGKPDFEPSSDAISPFTTEALTGQKENETNNLFDEWGVLDANLRPAKHAQDASSIIPEPPTSGPIPDQQNLNTLDDKTALQDQSLSAAPFEGSFEQSAMSRPVSTEINLADFGNPIKEDVPPSPGLVSLSGKDIPDFSIPGQPAQTGTNGDETDWQTFFSPGSPQSAPIESAPGVEKHHPVEVPGSDISISPVDRIRHSFHLTKSEWITIAAVTALAVLSLSTLVVVRFLLPSLASKTAGLLPSPTPLASTAIYPIRIEFGGSIKMDVSRNTTVDGKWEPKSAEWLSGSELRKVIAIPYSKEMLAIIRAQSIGDNVSLHMNNSTVMKYKITEIKEIDRNQTDVMTDTRPSILVILIEPGSDKRWVVIARQ